MTLIEARTVILGDMVTYDSVNYTGGVVSHRVTGIRCVDKGTADTSYKFQVVGDFCSDSLVDYTVLTKV